MRTFHFIYILLLLLVFDGLKAQIASPPYAIMDKQLLKEFVAANLTYPVTSKEGLVEIRFTTDKTGELISWESENNKYPALNKEAIRLLRLIIWKPAIKNGHPVQGNSTFEIEFNHKKYKKMVKKRGYDNLRTDFVTDTSFIIYKEKTLDTIAKASLPKGFNNLYNYVYSEITYPPRAMELEIEGKVEVSFVVETTGITTNFNIIQAVGGGCTNEAMRIIKEIRWTPAFKEGMAVRSYYSMFIEFRVAGVKDGKYMPNQTNNRF